ncbi:MAG: argininosuccinate lyase, partial [Armatimonadota bacterium]
LHTARSRNDQVVTDLRLALRSRILDVQEALAAFQQALLDLADRHAETVMPGYTHMQHAQPITVGFWAAGHAAALARDQQRLDAAFERTNLCPLGACALAGTSFPTDRLLTARLLGFDGIAEHSLDAVASRDFAAETLSALAVLMINLSRLAEEIIVWSTHEFGMVELDDEFAFGSSIMPQKKNPCILELVRARTGIVCGDLTRLMTTMKATPLGYNRDLQEDKPPLWESLDCVENTLGVMREVIRTLKVNAERMRELVGANFATATELANFLVREHGMPFRECHTLVGRLVRRLIDAGRTFDDVDLVARELEAHGVSATPEELGEVLDPERCVRRQKSTGSTNPDEVRRMIERFRGAVRAETTAKRRERINEARQRAARIVEQVLAGAAVKEAIDAAV